MSSYFWLTFELILSVLHLISTHKMHSIWIYKI